MLVFVFLSPFSPLSSLCVVCGGGGVGLFVDFSSPSLSLLKQVGLAKTNNYNLTITYFVDLILFLFSECVCVIFPNA